MSIDAQEDREPGGWSESVLRLRLAILRRNLEQVRDTGGSVAQRRSEIQALETVFDQTEGIQTRAGWVSDNVDEGMKLVEQLMRLPEVPKETVRRLRGRLSECARDAAQVKKQAERSANVIMAMSRRWSSLSADDVFDTHIREIFADKANDLMGIIDKLNDRPASAAWTIYQEQIRKAAGDLFSEYVEFLSGLALRDSGLVGPVTSVVKGEVGKEHEPGAEDWLGPDVYMMADDLVRQIYRIGESDLWHSIAIPARRDVAARTVARMIRLGFPEWTIWAVPLSAYEFGRVVIDKKRKEIFAWFESRGETLEPGFEILLADAFATYALGPVYAFASVYVLLDPSTAERRPRGGEQAVAGVLHGDSDRAFVVFRMLELMNEGKALTGVVDELRERWTTAVEQAGGAPPPTGQAAESLKRQTARACEFLRENAPRIRYGARRWEQATTWEPLADLVDGPWRLAPGHQDVRDILNAAWYQRLSTRAMPDPALDQRLADAALALWRGDLATRRKPSRQGMF